VAKSAKSSASPGPDAGLLDGLRSALSGPKPSALIVHHASQGFGVRARLGNRDDVELGEVSFVRRPALCTEITLDSAA
jgi:hypothetical protein